LSDAPASPTPLPQLTPPHITCSRGLADWLRANQVSLAFTSYQAEQEALAAAFLLHSAKNLLPSVAIVWSGRNLRSEPPCSEN
jgi:hypothetical protein